MTSNVEQIFTFIDRESTFMENQESATYLEGIVFALELWLEGKRVPEVTSPKKEEIRKAIQLAILKGMNKSTQPNHQMTPDALGLLVSYLVNIMNKDKETITILDPALGTGNLLYTVMNMLSQPASAYGVEIDELLIQLAAQTGELLEQDIQLFRQDGLRPLFIDPVDVVISDLPVGYYPDEDVSKDYQLNTTEEMPYAHHLFIEQSMRYVKEEGYLYFLVPAGLFESKQAGQLHKFIKEQGLIQAVLQLPDSLFKTKGQEKSLVILQKKSDSLRAPKDVLLAKVPNMTNRDAMALFLEKINTWQKEKSSR